MEVKLRIEDYLSKEDIKDILKEELRRVIRNDKERVLGNLGYSLGIGFIEELLDSDDVETIKSKVKEILNDKSSIKFQLFYKDVYGRSARALQVIEDEVKNQEEVLRDKIKKAIDLIDENKIAAWIEEEPYNVFELIKNYILYKL